MTKTDKIGIIGALSVEVDGLVHEMSNVRTTEIGGSTFYEGTLCDAKAVVVKCGVGKVNAAFVTSTLALVFGVGGIVMTGVCGGIGVKPMSAVVPSSFIQHDVDIDGLPRGHLDVLDRVEIEADEMLSEILAEVSDGVRAVMATGEQFIRSKEQTDRILTDFPSVGAVDMESAASAHICARLGVPFACIKTVSDGCSADEFYDFVTEASKKSVAAVMGLLKRL